MAGSRPGNLSHSGIVAFLFFCFLSPAWLPAQPIFVGRPEDQPGVSQRIALAVATARNLGPAKRRRMLPFLVQAGEALRTRELGKVLGGLSQAGANGNGREFSPAHSIAANTFLHALPELQESGKEAKVYLTARLLYYQDLPPRPEVIFRLRREVDGPVLAEKKFPEEIDRRMLLTISVVAEFSLAGYAPGRYIGEVEYRFDGKPVPGPIFPTQRKAFFLLADFKAQHVALINRYQALKQKAKKAGGPDPLAPARAGVVGLLGELSRPVDPARGNPPLAEVDHRVLFSRAKEWLDCLEKGKDPLLGLTGDQLVGVEVANGSVMPMRLYIPPDLPAPGKRRALLFLPGCGGGEADLVQVYGSGILAGLARKYGVLVACLQSGRLPKGGDVVAQARHTLINSFGASPTGVTIGGHGRGASQAKFACLADPKRWAGLVMVSGPPADPQRLAILPAGRTLYIEGADNPDWQKYLGAAEKAGKAGKVGFVLIPDAEHFLALAFGLDLVLAFAGEPPLGSDWLFLLLGVPLLGGLTWILLRRKVRATAH